MALLGSAAAGDGSGTSVNAHPCIPVGLRPNCELNLSMDVITLAGSGSRGNADGTGADASFDYPRGLGTDGRKLYITESANHAVRRLDLESTFAETLAGSGSSGDSTGIGMAAEFNVPTRTTTDGTYVYVADTGNHRIKRIDPETKEVVILAGSGSPGGDDGFGEFATFDGPRGITTDGTHLFVADQQGNTVRRIDLSTRQVITFAGSGSFATTDGTGTSAEFKFPRDVTTDGEYLYVTDGANLIRRIHIGTAVVDTIAGTGSEGHSDGNGTSASFDFPNGITTDGTYLYIADFKNQVIRRIE